MHDDGQQIAFRVYRDLALAALHLLARVVTAPPPFSAVLADCESIIATLGMAFCPFVLRPCWRSVLPNRSHTPLAPCAELLIDRLPRREIDWHLPPLAAGLLQRTASRPRSGATHTSARTPSAMPITRANFSKGSNCNHCASVKSLGYMLPSYEKTARAAYSFQGSSSIY
jgi:hypothetical protein